ncbi:MAG: flagellum-specific ATP synthase [Paracoccaceae bacterium]|jgi:flagellum-specific ATP synthase
MTAKNIEDLCARIGKIPLTHQMGRVIGAKGGCLQVAGLSGRAAVGDQVHLMSMNTGGEVVDLDQSTLTVLPDAANDGVRIGDPVQMLGAARIAPDDSWIGRIIDGDGTPLDGAALRRGPVERPLRGAPPPAIHRKAFGKRLATGLAAFDTLLPIVRGQRLGLFAGSGVGKSMLLGRFAGGIEADVVVIALVGERGRELRHFVEKVLGPERMKKTVLVVATSDMSPVARRRALWSAMTVAEHFRDAGQHVLFLADSVTRFAEAHREIALSVGESASLRGYPPSTAHMIMALAERAGPGVSGSAGDITAIFTVLVAGSDMEEPIADILRGVLDGHIVLDRQIAERGRYPAIDLLRSVSRSLPDAANSGENGLISVARKRLGAYDRAELMIQSGLYASGSDPDIDAAIQVWPALDKFLSEDAKLGPAKAFDRLATCLRMPALGAQNQR